MRERLAQDFGIGVDKIESQKQDAVSVVSSFDDEIDEWAALNKYAVLRSFQETMNRKQANKERQV